MKIRDPDSYYGAGSSADMAYEHEVSILPFQDPTKSLSKLSE
jgi:hypothetical protein